VVADIPGLIEGAHEGAGLGDEFLRHIERTSIILHMVDMYPIDGTDPVEDYNVITRELAQYSQKLADKPKLVVANKMDLAPQNDTRLAEFSQAIGQEVVAISAVTGKGLEILCEKIWKKLHPESGE
jgi:GTP-binding protein